jgi:hypothetical protein
MIKYVPLWVTTGALLIALGALATRRPRFAKGLGALTALVGLLVATYYFGELLATWRRPDLEFGAGLSETSTATMRAMLMPAWLRRALLSLILAALGMVVRVRAQRHDADAAPNHSAPWPERLWWGLVLLGGLALAWVELSLGPQVNATIAVANVAERLEVFNLFSRALPDTPSGPEGGAPVLDAWGHPFGYWKRGTCFVLVSYGSDGKPDTSEYDARLCESTVHSSTCWQPSMDTVFVNARPLHACLR